jgi:ABC-type transport system involved in multi-copper enzyme maturation permease subunit
MARGPLAVLLLTILAVVAIGIFVTGITREDGETVRLSLSFGAFWLLLCIVLVFHLTRARPEITP